MESTSTSECEWRCTRCGALLGVLAGRRVRVAHKRAQYLIDGLSYLVVASCGACGTLNERGRERPERARGGAAPAVIGVRAAARLEP